MRERQLGYDLRLCATGDLLDLASARLWNEIRRLLPRHRQLLELGRRRTHEQTLELRDVTARLAKMKRRSARYRDVLRTEAWARWLDEEERARLEPETSVRGFDA